MIMAIAGVEQGEDGSITTFWPDSYQVNHHWDASTWTHREWDRSGTLLKTETYTQSDVDAWLVARANSLANADTVERQVESALAQDLADLQALIDTPNATINAGPAPYIKALARVLRRLVRHAIRRFDSAS